MSHLYVVGWRSYQDSKFDCVLAIAMCCDADLSTVSVHFIARDFFTSKLSCLLLCAVKIVNESTLQLLTTNLEIRSETKFGLLYFVDRASRYSSLLMTNLANFFISLFITNIYMLRASRCSSSGDRIVLTRSLP